MLSSNLNIQYNNYKLFHFMYLVQYLVAFIQQYIGELKQATFLSTRTSTGSKPRRYRWRMMA